MPGEKVYAKVVAMPRFELGVICVGGALHAKLARCTPSDRAAVLQWFGARRASFSQDKRAILAVQKRAAGAERAPRSR